MKLIAIVLFLFPISSKADIFRNHDDFVHFVAHFGGSYALTKIVGGVAHKTLGTSKFASGMIGLGVTLVAGSIYKLSQPRSSQFGHQFATSTFRNTLGGISAVGTQLVFDF